ncbi:MAG: T9SS type A sorting domain-containing protein [Bacteroidales bacterium]|nr:T9SS type A sorting domain-containing protein [Bacteroidales bacterium]
MKNNKFIYAIALLMFSLQLNSQVMNINPDPNGDPWWTGDGVLLSPEEEALIPELELTPESAATLLPDEVYNNDYIYFPPIFLQQGASCVQAAEIGYTYTYEINRLRDVAAGVWVDENNRENLYYHLYTYNFLNQGSGSSFTSYTSGFSIIKENGCPMYNVYDDPALYTNEKFKYWMTDYNKYVSGMENRITGYNNIYFNYDYSSLEVLKHWIADHNTTIGPQTGGLAIISVNTGGWIHTNTLPAGTPHEGEYLITQLGSTPGTGHALTIVGYDESVKYDFNEDGLYTTDIDINEDGVVNLLDREIGAFKIANSWGANWKNQGFIWLPYKAMPGQLQGSDRAYVCHAIDNYEPQLAIKTSVEYPHRRKLKFEAGFANNANQTTTVSNNWYRSFKYQGGLNKMRGAYDGPIEFGLNYGYWYLNQDVGKIFLIIDENEYTTPSADGTIEYFSIVDYRWGEEFELYCNETNVSIVNDDETVLSIDYDLIPHESNITEDLSLFSNMVSRFTPTVDNNATLSVEDGVRIDMYDSEIHINPGSSLILENNVTFLAKTGSCKLIIDGNIIVGSNISFIAEEGAELDVILNNNSLQATFNNTTFEKARLNSYAQNLTIMNSTFDDCFIIYSHRGNVTITDNTVFDRTWLYLENTEDNNNTASVTHCIFTTDFSPAAIDLWNYNQYEISNNTIDGYYYNGIQILQSGYGDTKKNIISDNTITNCTQRGILVYGTRGTVYRNHITNNKYGIWFGDHSSIRLYGYSGAISYPQTQEIRDNDLYEVYASQYSFPIYFRYNVIIDEDNLGGQEDALVYYSEGIGGMTLKDVRYNCWYIEEENFDPEEDFYPGGYIWEPTWCPEIGGGIATDPDEDMYEVANNLFDAEDYTGAKSMYEMLIEQYPQSKFAKAAMQELFALEKFVSNDYSDLKQYYANNTDPELSETGDYLVSKCDIKLENWPDAVSYYENILLNPETMEDSIFAIIDLGYVYFVMENSGYKSAYTGNLVEYKPESKEQFIENRNYLLSLIPGDQMSETMKGNIAELKEGELLQNVPNPFKGSTQIWYKINTESNVQLNIYNYTGQLISTINEGTKTKGTHHIDFDANGLKNGIYFYSISINGQTTDSKKMTIME